MGLLGILLALGLLIWLAYRGRSVLLLAPAAALVAAAVSREPLLERKTPAPYLLLPLRRSDQQRVARQRSANFCAPGSGAM